jgi:cytoplasmic iron level regulating protein YaaA (DUF328/UPF0246 family)
VLVLLPPSEGKAKTRRRGKPFEVEALSFPALHETRLEILSALVSMCAGSEDKARQVLGLPPGLAHEAAKNRALWSAPAMPAGSLYTGVLYDALDLASLDTAARRRANRWLVVSSGLWGALRLTDRVPPYRLSGDVTLPGVGGVASAWRGPLSIALPEAARGGLVLDLRSSMYSAAWRPTGELASRSLSVRVLQERTPGDRSSRTVVSHFNKSTKGRLVRALLTSGAEPRNVAGLVGALRDLGFNVENPVQRQGKPWSVDVVVTG